jgi:hypothetical protein
VTPSEIEDRLREMEDINTDYFSQINACIDGMLERLKEEAFEQKSQIHTSIEIGEDHG